jgi:hypothetical protein
VRSHVFLDRGAADECSAVENKTRLSPYVDARAASKRYNIVQK